MPTSSNFFSSFLILLMIGLYSCNPDCESYTNVNSKITPQNRLPGEKMLVQTNPTDFLENRDLFIEQTRNGKLVIDEDTKLESEYMTELQGRVATLPANAEGNRNLYIEDRDCGGFIPLSSVNVVDQSFISDNPSLFITPPRANIIIPTIPTVSPTNITNTWFSPDNRDYCIWIVPEFIKQASGCYAEGKRLTPGNLATGPGTKNSGSWELSVGLANGCFTDAKAYHGNPVTDGIIDTLTGYVSITIDRTGNGLPVETYEGTLLDVESSGLSEDDVKLSTQLPCSPIPGTVSAEKFIILTSTTTGHQILIFRQDAVGLGFHELPFCKTE